MSTLLGHHHSGPANSAALEDAGIPSHSVDPRSILVTDSQHGSAQPDVDATDLVV